MNISFPLSFFVFILFANNFSIAFAADCSNQWQLQEQQSEGYKIDKPCSKSHSRIEALEIELHTMGRVVLSKLAQQRELELVCDNNSAKEITLSVGEQKDKIKLLNSEDDCQWNNSVYRCSNTRVFCSISHRIAVNYGESPTASTSVTMRSSIFPFKYKEDIILGVKDIKNLISACADNVNDEEISASWFIAQSGKVIELEVSDLKNNQLKKCAMNAISNYVFTKHEFATQYWVQTF